MKKDGKMDENKTRRNYHFMCKSHSDVWKMDENGIKQGETIILCEEVTMMLADKMFLHFILPRSCSDKCRIISF